jgi:hypothetical protein
MMMLGRGYFSRVLAMQHRAGLELSGTVEINQFSYSIDVPSCICVAIFTNSEMYASLNMTARQSCQQDYSPTQKHFECIQERLVELSELQHLERPSSTNEWTGKFSDAHLYRPQ